MPNARLTFCRFWGSCLSSNEANSTMGSTKFSCLCQIRHNFKIFVANRVSAPQNDPFFKFAFIEILIAPESQRNFLFSRYRMSSSMIAYHRRTLMATKNVWTVRLNLEVLKTFRIFASSGFQRFRKRFILSCPPQLARQSGLFFFVLRIIVKRGSHNPGYPNYTRMSSKSF